MIGVLPKSLNINGVDYDIRTDYRDCLNIIQAYADPDLTDQEKIIILLKCLYYDWEKFNDNDIEEAYRLGVSFLDRNDNSEPEVSQKPLYDFEQDEQIIFSAINKVAGKEIREVEYMHWWTFLSLFNEIGESTFATVISIRDKKRHNKKLEKWEKDFYKKNKNMIDLKVKYTAQEEAERDEVRKLLGII